MMQEIDTNYNGDKKNGRFLDTTVRVNAITGLGNTVINTFSLGLGPVMDLKSAEFTSDFSAGSGVVETIMALELIQVLRGVKLNRFDS